jgi:hypothetical protein
MVGKIIRHPISGALLLPNAGAATGVYANPDYPTLEAPDWNANDPPNFIEPINNVVGESITVDLGTPVPLIATTTVRLGVGTSSTNFNGPFIENGGTIPAEWAGKQPVAEFTVSNGPLHKTMHVLSGVTVEVASDGFPDYATYDVTPVTDWQASEVRTGSVAGRRLIHIDNDVVVPSGFILRVYSGTNPLGVPNDGATFPITVGESFTTPNSLATNSTCYNYVYWKRISDGAYKVAHEAAPVSFLMQGLIVIIPPPDTNIDFTPDTTVSGLAAVRAAIQARINSGSTGHYVIADNISTSGVYDLSGFNNSIATNTANWIIVRKIGSYSDTACTIKHTGTVSFNNSTGIHLAMTHITGYVSGTGHNLCGLTNCIVESGTPNINVIPTANYGVNLTGSNFRLAHNVWRYWGDSAVLFWNGDGHQIIGNIGDYLVSDEIKVFGYLHNSKIERNWSCRIYFFVSGGHPDFFQNQGGNGQFNQRYYGNVLLVDAVNGGSAWWLQGSQLRVVPGDYIPLTGSYWEQNLVFAGLTFVNGFTNNPGLYAKYNSLITAGDPGAAGCVIKAMMFTRDYNYVVCAGGHATAGTNANDSAGPNGLGRKAGDAIGAGDYSRDYSVMTNDFTYGVPWQNSAGVFITRNDQTIKAFEPKTGTRLHWLHSNPVGAYLRSREIFDPSYRATAEAAAGYPVYPFSWPVLGTQHARYNSDNYVTDGYTGSWSANTGLPV